MNTSSLEEKVSEMTAFTKRLVITAILMERHFCATTLKNSSGLLNQTTASNIILGRDFSFNEKINELAFSYVLYLAKKSDEELKKIFYEFKLHEIFEEIHKSKENISQIDKETKTTSSDQKASCLNACRFFNHSDDGIPRGICMRYPDHKLNIPYTHWCGEYKEISHEFSIHNQ